MSVKSIINQILLFEKKYINLFGVPLHKNETYNPFFIVGSGRSGSTLLRRILNNHSELFIPPETYVLGQSISQSLYYPQLSWSDLVSLIYSNFEYHNEFETYKMGSLRELDSLVTKTKVNQRSVAYILNAFYDQFRMEHKISSLRWGDKTPLNTFAMEEIHAVFPMSKFIHIIRNPYDSIVSYVKSSLYSDLDSATLRWKKSVELAMKFGIKYPDSYYEIFYHDLVTDAKNSVKKICNYLDINYEITMLAENNNIDLGDVTMRKHHVKVIQPIDENSIGNGKKSLSEGEIKNIDKIIRTSTSKKLITYFERMAN